MIQFGDERLPYRFWSKIEIDDNGCWNRRGANNGLGYGRIWWNGVRCYSHRLSYEILIGPIQSGYDIDHLCRNPPCVNPLHLEPVSHAENVRRGASPAAKRALQTHCIRGHEFTPKNTYYRKDTKNGWRTCIKCLKIRKKR